MHLTAAIPALAACALTTGLCAPAAAETLQFVVNGVAVANTRPAPTTKAYTDWCKAATGACFPTVQQPVHDTATGQRKGMVYIWGAFPFSTGAVFPGAICFSEFMLFELDQGDLVVHTGPNGTCGAFIDPLLKPPRYPELGATAVVAGGGDGVIAGGTRKFERWTGTFSDRVFVGFGQADRGAGGIIYYDQLLFTITGAP